MRWWAEGWNTVAVRSWAEGWLTVPVRWWAEGWLTCLESVVGVSKSVLPAKCFHSHKSSFLHQSNFMKIIRLSQC